MEFCFSALSPLGKRVHPLKAKVLLEKLFRICKNCGRFGKTVANLGKTVADFGKVVSDCEETEADFPKKKRGMFLLQIILNDISQSV